MTGVLSAMVLFWSACKFRYYFTLNAGENGEVFGWNRRSLFRETEKRVIMNSGVYHSSAPVEASVLPAKVSR